MYTFRGYYSCATLASSHCTTESLQCNRRLPLACRCMETKPCTLYRSLMLVMWLRADFVKWQLEVLQNKKKSNGPPPGPPLPKTALDSMLAWNEWRAQPQMHPEVHKPGRKKKFPVTYVADKVEWLFSQQIEQTRPTHQNNKMARGRVGGSRC